MTLDMTTMTIMRKLPREVDPVVYHMMTEDPGEVAYNSIGGLSEQIRELREVRRRQVAFNLQTWNAVQRSLSTLGLQACYHYEEGLVLNCISIRNSTLTWSDIL